MSKHTPLNAAHRRLGAKLIDFGGWEMPLHYGSQIEEHHRVRREAGVFDVSHMLALDCTGPDSARFLRYALANDIAKLEQPGRALYSCLLNDAAGIVDDLIVCFVAANRYRLVLNAAAADRDLAWLEALRARLGARCEIAPRRNLAMLAVQGPQARVRVWTALPAIDEATRALARFHAVVQGELLVSRTGYTGEDGFELALPAEQAGPAWEALLRAGVAPCGLGARDTLRLEAGMNLYGQDMDESVTPAECGLERTVDASRPRDFCGKPAFERERPVRKRVGLVLLERGVLRARQRVLTEHGEGHITSGGFAPTLSRSIALARVPREVAPGETVRVEVRDKQLAARAVSPPFVRNGAILVSLE